MCADFTRKIQQRSNIRKVEKEYRRARKEEKRVQKRESRNIMSMNPRNANTFRVYESRDFY
jgi:hypothetical protein